MASWMMYAIIIALLIGIAAYLGELASEHRQGRRRWIWLSAIGMSVILPLAISTIAIQIPVSEKLGGTTSETFALKSMGRVSLPLPTIEWNETKHGAISGRIAINLDALLRRCWNVLSIVLLAAIALNTALVALQRKRWRKITLCNRTVLISDRSGPAVVGLFRPRVVLPAWVLAEPRQVHQAILAHEFSHISERDPQLLAVALIFLTVMPWNVPLWWQVRRLRRAMELDCDARVLKGGIPIEEYCNVLLKVGYTKSRLLGPVAAMAESKSFLERRLEIMLNKPKRIAGSTLALLTACSIAIAAAATQVSPPSASASADLPTATAPAVDYANYVGWFEIAPMTVIGVTANSNQLTATINQKNAIPLVPTGTNTFTDSTKRATFAFSTNGPGQAGSVDVTQNGRTRTAHRVDAVAANTIIQTIQSRVRSQQPSLGSDKAIRLILSDPDSPAGMSPDVADMRTKQKAAREQYLSKLGPVSSYEFEGISPQGWDKYLVRHQNGTEQLLLLLDNEGTIVGAARS